MLLQYSYLVPADARKGGGPLVTARQTQLARSFAKAKLDVIGLHECRLPGSQCGTTGTHTCVYSEGPSSKDGCGFWISALLAQHLHITVFNQEPSRLIVVVRATDFALNAMVMHATFEGSSESEVWWIESGRVACLLPFHCVTLYFCRCQWQSWFFLECSNWTRSP